MAAHRHPWRLEHPRRIGGLRRDRDWFLIHLKTTALGMKKNSVYDVQVRILPATADPKPVGYDAGVTDNFDVGSRGLKVKAEK